jgi:DNA modification methylase
MTSVLLPHEHETYGTGFTYSSFFLHETGLSPIGSPTREEWLECWRFVTEAEKRIHFWIGDLLRYAEAHFRQDYEEAIALTGFSYHTLRRDKYTASRIEPERRRSSLDVAIHQEVAPLPVPLQETLLDKAEKNGLTVAQIRQEKRNLLLASPPALLPPPHEHPLPLPPPVADVMHINHIYQGDALTVLRSFPPECIDMVMTSPPYWALRDYDIEGQLGLEPTCEEYLLKLCAVFDEVKRVLKKTGSCWVNIGDTYSATRWSDSGGTSFMNTGKNAQKNQVFQKHPSLPDKCLTLIPFRFAIEMINRGWILRNTLIWHKPNAMPESVLDRFTEDFEYLFFFVKSQQYYFAQQFEPLAAATLPRFMRGVSDNNKYADADNGKIAGAGELSNPRPNRKHIHNAYGTGGQGFVGHSGYCKANGEPLFHLQGRNKRAVWQIATTSYSGAHFAVYPEELCQTPIKAGCPQRGIVCDPFLGAGTTALVAKRLGRSYIGIDLNPDYVRLAQQRLANHPGEAAS